MKYSEQIKIKGTKKASSKHWGILLHLYAKLEDLP